MNRPVTFERQATVDLARTASNVHSLTARLRQAELMAVVKADAYGHGAAEVGRAALEAGAHALGVAHVREATALREALLAGPRPLHPRILAWLHTSSTDFEAALRSDIQLGVSGPEISRLLEAAASTGITPDVHVKVDTGLGRNGAPEPEWESLFGRLSRLQEKGTLFVTGIMSHLAVADEPERPETDAQKASFERACASAERAGLRGLIRHLANTPATLSREDLHYDMVRVGLGLYGLSPFADRTPQELGLTPVMSLSARLSAVKAVQPGQGVSYGLAWTAEAPTHLGLVAAGYADGVPRIATGAEVSIRGQRYGVVGRIAMDQMVVDLGADPAALDLIGEEVRIFGGPGAPTAEDWARAAQTIGYEIITRISQRVDREYINGGPWPEPEIQPATEPGPETEEATGAAGSQVADLLGVHSADDAEGMRDLGRRLGSALTAGDVLILSGPLGAGKTTLTQGIAQGLGVAGSVISPTFVLTRIHPNDPAGPRPGGPDLVHVDAYRLGPDGDLGDLGLDDTLSRSVTAVEWGEALDTSLGRRTLRVRIERAALLGGERDDDGALNFDDEEAEDPRRITIEQLSPPLMASAAPEGSTTL